MAKFNIYSSDGQTIKYSGCPTYNGNFMKVAYLEFKEIASSIPISWAVGDYIDYDKTGLRYKLYFLPQPTKNATSGQSGKAFVYNNVQFYADTKKLDIAPFRDLVLSDNQIHFSTQQNISTYESVSGIANRLQACMDEFDNGNWTFTVVSSTLTSELKEFSVSGVSVLEALQKIYDTWDEKIGWWHSVVNGVNVITIAETSSTTTGGITNTFLYGKGNGLKSIKKSQANVSEMATRLYVYGSNRNMYPRYYNGKSIKYADLVDIQNLMIPLSSWGLTDNLPDPRKAYIENTTAVTNYGLIPKSVYFDGGDNDEIYPSIKNVTIKQIRDAKTELGETTYIPSTTIYTDETQRVDEVLSVTNPSDNGLENTNGTRFTTITSGTFPQINGTKTFPANTETKITTFDTTDFATMTAVTSGAYSSNLTIKSALTGTITTDSSIRTKVELIVLLNGEEKYAYEIAHTTGTFTFEIVDRIVGTINASTTMAIKFRLTCQNMDMLTAHTLTLAISSIAVDFCQNHSLSSMFTMSMRQIGFDLTDRAALNDGVMIHFIDGNCAGREFKVSKCTYVSASDSWELRMSRGIDEDLEMYFPNTTYPISIGDHFVILDIAMPELYITMASQRLLSAGQNLLAQTSKIIPYYEPDIDAKKVIENLTTYPNDESYKLREGKFLALSDTDVVGSTTSYILIDAITINENESNIPTYKVTLRESKKVSYSQSTAEKISSLEQKVVDNTGTLKSATSSGNVDYNNVSNKPTINGVELSGNQTGSDLGLMDGRVYQLTTSDTFADVYMLIDKADWSASKKIAVATILANFLDKTTGGTISGNVTATGFIVSNSSSSYVLLGDGTTKLLTQLTVGSANNAGHAIYTSLIGASSSSHPQIGDTYIPVYVNSNGQIVACTLSTLKITQGGVQKGTYTPMSSDGEQTIELDSGGSGATNLSDLLDVLLSASIDENDLLVYQTINGVSKWRNVDLTSLNIAEQDGDYTNTGMKASYATSAGSATNATSATTATTATQVTNQAGGNALKFYKGSSLPATTDDDTIYFIF